MRRDWRSVRFTMLDALTPEERFWVKVKRGAADECWPWLGNTNANGYGLVPVLSPAGRRSTRPASRVSYELTHGVTLPRHLFVCHRCDNPPCCNPEHLFLGTATDNMQDAQRKGRFPVRQPRVPKPKSEWLTIGSKSKNAKLTEDDVREMRQSYAEGHGSMSELAALYGIDIARVSRIINRKAWKHVPDDHPASAAA